MFAFQAPRRGPQDDANDRQGQGVAFIDSDPDRPANRNSGVLGAYLAFSTGTGLADGSVYEAEVHRILSIKRATVPPMNPPRVAQVRTIPNWIKKSDIPTSRRQADCPEPVVVPSPVGSGNDDPVVEIQPDRLSRGPVRFDPDAFPGPVRVP